MLPKILEEKSRDAKGFGNGRGVRNLFEHAIANQADRLSTDMENLTREKLMQITAEDLISAANESDGSTLEKAALESTLKDLLSSAGKLAENVPSEPEERREADREEPLPKGGGQQEDKA